MRAEWHNTETFRVSPDGVVGCLRRRRLFVYRPHPHRPTFLRVWADDGIMFHDWRPIGQVLSDYGSIPYVLQCWSRLSNSLFPMSYIFHDAACADGRLLSREPMAPGGSAMLPWAEQVISRADADRILRLAVVAEGGGGINAGLIYLGVRLAAPFMRHPTGGWGTKAGQGQL